MSCPVPNFLLWISRHLRIPPLRKTQIVQKHRILNPTHRARNSNFHIPAALIIPHTRDIDQPRIPCPNPHTINTPLTKLHMLTHKKLIPPPKRDRANSTTRRLRVEREIVLALRARGEAERRVDSQCPAASVEHGFEALGAGMRVGGYDARVCLVEVRLAEVAVEAVLRVGLGEDKFVIRVELEAAIAEDFAKVDAARARHVHFYGDAGGLVREEACGVGLRGGGACGGDAFGGETPLGGWHERDAVEFYAARGGARGLLWDPAVDAEEELCCRSVRYRGVCVVDVAVVLIVETDPVAPY